MNFQTMSKQRKFILIAAAVGVISVFLPWVSVSFGPFGGSFSENGFNGIGILVFLCLVASGVLAFMGDQTKNLDKTVWMVILIAAGIASLIMVINFLRTMGTSGAFSVIGFGFYLTTVASLAVLGATYMFRSPGDSIKGGFDSLKGDIEKKTDSSKPTT